MRKYPQLNIRISPEILKLIRKEAKHEKRSLVAQITYIFEYYLEGLGLLPKENEKR